MTQVETIAYQVVIPAGGVGSRYSNSTEEVDAQLPKQLLHLHGKSVIEHAVKPFLNDPNCKKIVIASHKDFLVNIQSIFSDYPEKIIIVEGGKTRQESVRKGCVKLVNQIKSNKLSNNERTWVFVHDAARPNLRFEDIEKLKSFLAKQTQLYDNQANITPFGVILATASQETVKQVALSEDNHHVEMTLNRDAIWNAKTPQVFRLSELLDALEQAREDETLTVTDEASAFENRGGKVFIVEGRSDNLKLTHKTDWQLLEFLIKQR